MKRPRSLTAAALALSLLLSSWGPSVTQALAQTAALSATRAAVIPAGWGAVTLGLLPELGLGTPSSPHGAMSGLPSAHATLERVLLHTAIESAKGPEAGRESLAFLRHLPAEVLAAPDGFLNRPLSERLALLNQAVEAEAAPLRAEAAERLGRLRAGNATPEDLARLPALVENAAFLAPNAATELDSYLEPTTQASRERVDPLLRRARAAFLAARADSLPGSESGRSAVAAAPSNDNEAGLGLLPASPVRPAPEAPAVERAGAKSSQFGLLGLDALPINAETGDTSDRWIPALRDVARGGRAPSSGREALAGALLANYAPTASDIAGYGPDALPALRVRARDESLAHLEVLEGSGQAGAAGLNLAKLRETVEAGDYNGTLRSLEAEAVQLERSLGRLSADEGRRAGEALRKLLKVQTELKTVADHVKLTADGVGRTFVHYWTPDGLREEQLARGWYEPKAAAPVADVAVIGGGQGGLASAYYASEALGRGDAGLRTVLIEGGYIGQAFSDGGSPGVHWLRTSRWTTNLAVGGIAPMDHVAAIGMPRVSEQLGFKTRGAGGRADVEARTGSRYIGRSREELRTEALEETPRRWRVVRWLLTAVNRLLFHALRERRHPQARNEVFQYYAHVAGHLADHPNAMVLENSPVRNVHKRADGLWEVTTAQGHRQLARRLVVATGVVGTDAEYAQLPAEFARLEREHPGDYLSLGNFAALGSKAEELDRLFAGMARRRRADPHFATSDRQLLFVDTLLRTPEAQRWLKSLPAGARVGVVGSGESAAKAVIDILIQNPGVKVSMFVKAQLEPAQVQVPENFFTPELAKRGLFDAEFGRHTVDQWKRAFGTPITPQTMIDLLTAQQQGKVQIYELGSHFNAQNVQLSSYKRPGAGESLPGEVVTRITVTDPKTVANLQAQAKDWRARGLPVDLGRETADGSLRLPEIDGGFVMATGFDRKKLRKLHPMLQQLVDQGAIELTQGDERKYYNGELKLDPDNRLTSAKDPTLGFAGFVNHDGSASDSTIAGAGARAYYLMLHMKNSLRRESAAPSEAMGPHTQARLGRLPELEGRPGTQSSYRRTPAANPVTLDPSLALLDLLPWPILSSAVQYAAFGQVNTMISMLPIPATLVPGLGRFVPFYRQLFSYPIDVIVRRLGVRRLVSGVKGMSATDRLLVERADQLRARQNTPLDRFHLGEFLQSLGGLIASFRVWRPWAVNDRRGATPSRGNRWGRK